MIRNQSCENIFSVGTSGAWTESQFLNGRNLSRRSRYCISKNLLSSFPTPILGFSKAQGNLHIISLEIWLARSSRGTFIHGLGPLKLMLCIVLFYLLITVTMSFMENCAQVVTN